ncbi:hypothetical protein Taro_004069 [Colocasia esculenta]|uniref:Uncharacterized protein n=1 Tax=Colocasia esculenta TaxID=4460 RepID=A0A843TL60_COLES|nr:hypothetical protein [Colocasia esculenta]
MLTPSSSASNPAEILIRLYRLASTPMPPRATATLNVHILSRQVHAVNVHLPGCQPVNGHPWPPTPTELQQLNGFVPYLKTR